MKETITVQTIIIAPVGRVWECWNKPEYITGWAFASNDWEAPAAENDLRVGGKFKTVTIMQDKYSNSDTSHVHFDILLRQRSKPNPVTRSLSRIYTLMTHTQQIS